MTIYFNQKRFYLKYSFLSIILTLSFGIVYESITSQSYATPITSNSQAPMSAQVSHHYHIIHALAHFFHIHSFHAPNTTSSHPVHSPTDPANKNSLNLADPHIAPYTIQDSTITPGTQSSPSQPDQTDIQSNHFLGEIFGPYSFTPSAKTQKNSAGKIPVILVHGTWANGNSMSDIYHSLDKAGIPTYVSTFGQGGFSLAGLIPFVGGVTPIAETEKQLAQYIDKVQKETGATKVDLVGHSQGGLVIKDYIAHDTKNNVQAVVDLGATNHGTTLGKVDSEVYSLPKFAEKILVKTLALIFGQGAADQPVHSDFIKNLNKYPDTKAGIHYLVLASRDDTISTPYQNTYLKPVPGADVTNLEVHSLPGVTGEVSHISFPFNPAIIHAVTQYIETKGEPAQSIKRNASLKTTAHTPAAAHAPLAVSLLD